MDADDDIIQSMLRAQQVDSLPIEPAAAWSAVGPRVARIRRNRMALRSGLIGLVAAGSMAIGSVAVMVHSRPDGVIRTSESDDMTFVIDDTAPGLRASQTTIEIRQGVPASAGGTIRNGSEGSGPDPHGSGPEPTSTQPDVSSTTSIVDDRDVRPDAPVVNPTPQPPPTTVSPDHEPTSTSTTVQVTIQVPAPQQPTTTSTVDEDRDTTGTGATTTTAGPSGTDETLACTCGSVVADRTGSHARIISVTAESGYLYRVEDPDDDDGSITVQFFGGGGEDCELKIPSA